MTYEDGDEMKIVRPDFIFFSKTRGRNHCGRPSLIRMASILPTHSLN